MRNPLHLFRHLDRYFNRFEFQCRMESLVKRILHDTTPGVTDERHGPHDIIVSLTTTPRRLFDVPLAIESLMQQTLRANRIILWLDHETMWQPFPEALKRQQARGLEIRECDNLRSYKKLIPSLREFPDAAIITVDDDHLYDFDLIERLVKGHQERPEAILATRIHRIMRRSDGSALPYHKWKLRVDNVADPRDLFFTTGAGVLFPPRSLSEETLDFETFMAICPTADDVWFNAMARLGGSQVVKIATRDPHGEDYIVNPHVQDESLSDVNFGPGGANTRQYREVFSRFKLL